MSERTEVEQDNSRRYLGYFVCTASDPYDPRKHGTHARHPDAKSISRNDPYFDHYICPNCSKHFTVEVPE